LSSFERSSPIFLHENVFAVFCRQKNKGVSLAETDDYDEIFAALKHPIRRQVLLFLEDKGEASFTEIQDAVGMGDTGLMSYHLKELAPLVEQSTRGKYCLSEVGRASITLFRKVEMEKDKTSRVVHREIEQFIGKAVFLFFIIGVAMMAPLSVDIYSSVTAISQSTLSMEQASITYFMGLLGMILGVLLFVFWDRHYSSKDLRKNVIHTTFFAAIPALLSMFSVYVRYSFEQVTLASSGTQVLLLGALRSISLMIIAPVLAYGIGRLLRYH
jgi:DNA-binding transcriptional ArsR family regulator